MSEYEDFKWMLQYTKMLDPINAKILEGLGEFGPRNIAFLAKSLRLPPTTVRFRIKRLFRKGYLKIHAILDHYKLGLMKATLITEAFPGYDKNLWRVIENLGYWTSATRCYGRYNGLYVLFAFPAEHKKKFKDYLDEATGFKGFSHKLLFWTTNPSAAHPSFFWFNFDRKRWDFQWQKWIDEILDASESLPKSLMDPEACSLTVDETDLLILKELEKNAVVEFTELADVVGLTPEGVRYRYYEHIVKQNLTIDYDVAIFLYPPQVSDMCSFVIDFENQRVLARFVNSLRNKPFVISYAKVVGQNSLIAHTYTPKMQFPGLIASLNRLAKEEFIRNFFYVTLDLASFQRQTVSYEFFNNGTWTYNHRKALKRLRELIGEH